jgi:hypothetical protein
VAKFKLLDGDFDKSNELVVGDDLSFLVVGTDGSPVKSFTIDDIDEAKWKDENIWMRLLLNQWALFGIVFAVMFVLNLILGAKAQPVEQGIGMALGIAGAATAANYFRANYRLQLSLKSGEKILTAFSLNQAKKVNEKKPGLIHL